MLFTDHRQARRGTKSTSRALPDCPPRLLLRRLRLDLFRATQVEMNRMPNVRDTGRMSEASGAIEAAGHVGAVVLTWRDTEKTARCVSELIRSPLLTNIVAVDNESDGSLESALPADARIRIIQHRRNIGFAAGVNSGIRDLLSHPNVESVLV